MTILRSVAGLLLALGLAGTASPALAQTKQYTLVMDPQTVTSGTNQPLKAYFKNTSPTGGANSSFNALRLKGPNTYSITKVTKVTRSDSQQPIVSGITANAQEILIQSLTSVGKGVTVTIEFEATVPNDCTPARWNPAPDDDVWSGSQIGSGQVFALQAAPASQPNTTTVYDRPTLEITEWPTNVGLGVPFKVTVTQTKTCTAASFPAVSLSGAGYAATESNDVQTSPDGNTRTTTFTGSFTGTIATSPTTLILTTSDGVQQKTASINVYADGQIACNEEVDKTLANNGQTFDPLEPGQAKSVRQLWNSNAASCLKTPIDFTNTLAAPSGDKLVSLVWPSSETDSQRAALFRTTVTGKLRSLSSTAVPPPPGFQFGWAKDGSGNVIYADALMCLDEEAPRPYAKLGSSVDSVAIGAQFQVQWDPDAGDEPVAPGTGDTKDPNGWKPIPATGNFEFTIGDERFVGKRAGSESTDALTGVKTVTIEVVDRNVGSTPSATTPLPAGTFLLSVVMPIYTAATPTIYANKPVRMCVIANGIRMYVPAAGAAGSLPTPQYFQTLEFFDGDGWGVER